MMIEQQLHSTGAVGIDGDAAVEHSNGLWRGILIGGSGLQNKSQVKIATITAYPSGL